MRIATSSIPPSCNDAHPRNSISYSLITQIFLRALKRTRSKIRQFFENIATNSKWILQVNSTATGWKPAKEPGGKARAWNIRRIFPEIHVCISSDRLRRSRPAVGLNPAVGTVKKDLLGARNLPLLPQMSRIYRRNVPLMRRQFEDWQRKVPP